jgi:membrane-associated protease RseP (regulator of RpoE activity)
MVGHVLPDTPAAIAGLVPGDTVVKFAGYDIDCPISLIEAMAFTVPDRPIDVVIRRPGHPDDIGPISVIPYAYPERGTRSSTTSTPKVRLQPQEFDRATASTVSTGFQSTTWVRSVAISRRRILGTRSSSTSYATASKT